MQMTYCMINAKGVYHHEGLFIESWSGSSEYSTDMLTEGAQSWRVEDNIEVEYLELSENIYSYLSITRSNDPILPRFVVNKPRHVDYKPIWTAQTLTFSHDFLLMVTYDATLA